MEEAILGNILCSPVHWLTLSHSHFFILHRHSSVYKHMCTQTDKHADRRIDRQTDRQTNRQAGRHTNIYMYAYTYFTHKHASLFKGMLAVTAVILIILAIQRCCTINYLCWKATLKRCVFRRDLKIARDVALLTSLFVSDVSVLVVLEHDFLQCKIIRHMLNT